MSTLSQVPNAAGPRTALASFPRSGNTWLRYMIEQATGRQTGSIYSDRILPRSTEGIVVKTHKRDSHEYERAIHIVRNPFDVLESYFHFRQDIEGSTDLSWEDHVRCCTVDWLEHTKHWLTCGLDTLLVRYEDLHATPDEWLARVLEWIGVRFDPEHCKRVAHDASLVKMRTLHSQLGPLMFRRGRVGDALASFPPGLRRYVAHELKPVLLQLGYTESGGILPNATNVSEA